MAVEAFFRNERTGKRYKIVSFNKEAGTVTLVGDHGIPFDEKFSKERFVNMGYTLIRDEAPAAPATVAPAPPPPVMA